MDQIVGKRARRTAARTVVSEAHPISTPSRFPITGLNPELEQRTAAALSTLMKRGMLDVFERREIADLLDHYRLLVAGEALHAQGDLARLRFSEFGTELFSDLVALVRLQDTQIAELQATLAEFI